MDEHDEHALGGGEPPPRARVAVMRSPRTGRPPSPASPVEPGNRPAEPAGEPRPEPSRIRPTLATSAAVCVIAASLAVVGWIHSAARESVPQGGRYAVVETSPGAPSDAGASPQPLVPLLPPDRSAGGIPRTGAASRKPAAATPSGRASASRSAAPVETGRPVGAISGFAGKCLHVPGNNPVDGIPVEMTACDGNPGEQWTMASDGTIRAFDKCLSLLGEPAADGAAVQLSTCRGATGQQWRFTAGRDLVNPQADKCLDVKDFNPGDGALLQVWTCAGSINQKWSVPA
jgi:hypothetical protein